MSALGDTISTETFLLPGQQFCIGLPWERKALPVHGVPAKPRPPPLGSTLDAPGQLLADVVAGAQIGACEVIRRLSPGSARVLLALREEGLDGAVPVVLRRIDLPEVLATEVCAHADWAAGLRHPNLAHVFPCEVTDEGIFWVTELATGATLAEISAACRATGKSIPVGLALAVIHDAALGLAELHAPPGLAHGLMCDSSVAVDFEGGARLLDVGLFRVLARQKLWSEVKQRIAPYLAPEQVLRGQLPDSRCDVFSLAALLHELLSGVRREPPRGEDGEPQLEVRTVFVPPSRLNVALGPAVDEVMGRALAPEPKERFATATDFACALRRAAADQFWRPALRAQFVGTLFAERKRQEEVLFAGLEYHGEVAGRTPVKRRTITLRAVRPPPLPKKQAAPAPAFDLPEPDEFCDSSEFEEIFEPRPLRPLLLTLLAVSLTWLWQSGIQLDALPRTAPPFARHLAQQAVLAANARLHFVPTQWVREPLPAVPAVVVPSPEPAAEAAPAAVVVPSPEPAAEAASPAPVTLVFSGAPEEPTALLQGSVPFLLEAEVAPGVPFARGPEVTSGAPAGPVAAAVAAPDAPEVKAPNDAPLIKRKLPPRKRIQKTRERTRRANH